MTPVRVSVVAPVDSSGNLPGEFSDLSDAAWRGLLNATLKMSEYDDPTALPIIVRPTELFRVSTELLLLPRMRRPVIRFGVGGDPPGFSPEWVNLESGYYHLCSGVLGQRAVHLWVVGHAWLCFMGLQLPTPKTLYISEIGSGKHFDEGVCLLKKIKNDRHPESSEYCKLEFTPVAADCMTSKWPLHMFHYTHLTAKDEIFAMIDNNEEIVQGLCGLGFPKWCRTK